MKLPVTPMEATFPFPSVNSTYEKGRVLTDLAPYFGDQFTLRYPTEYYLLPNYDRYIPGVPVKLQSEQLTGFLGYSDADDCLEMSAGQGIWSLKDHRFEACQIDNAQHLLLTVLWPDRAPNIPDPQKFGVVFYHRYPGVSHPKRLEDCGRDVWVFDAKSQHPLTVSLLMALKIVSAQVDDMQKQAGAEFQRKFNAKRDYYRDIFEHELIPRITESIHTVHQYRAKFSDYYCRLTFCECGMEKVVDFYYAYEPYHHLLELADQLNAGEPWSQSKVPQQSRIRRQPPQEKFIFTVNGSITINEAYQRFWSTP